MSNMPNYDETPEEDTDFGQAPEHAEIPSVKTDFQRWHHPRKQWVRVQQWCSASRRLIKELGLPNGEPFRYLTLPGDELLDIRALSDAERVNDFATRVDLSLSSSAFTRRPSFPVG